MAFDIEQMMNAILNPDQGQAGEDTVLAPVGRVPSQYRQPPSPPMPENPAGAAPTRQVAQMRKPSNYAAIQDWLEQQKGGVSALEQLAQQYGQHVDKRRRETNLSPLMQLSDMLFGGNLAKGYDAPPTEEEALAGKAQMQRMVNQARDPIAQEMLRQYASDNSAESKYFRQLSSKLTGGDKEARKLADNVMFRRGVAPQVRIPIMTLNRVNAANTMIENVLKDQKGKVDPQELRELGASVAQVVLNSNDITDEKFKAFVAENLKTQMASLSQYILSKPKGIDQKEWLNRYKRTLKREQQTAKQALKAYQGGEYKIAEGLGMDPSSIEAVKSGANYWLDTGYPDVEIGDGLVAVYDKDGNEKFVKPENLEKARASGFNPK